MSERTRPLTAWRTLLAEKTDCPYVGPRPQQQGDGNVLFGREEDIKRIRRVLRKRSIVVVDGYSGAGKSSLLQNGLQAQLKDDQLDVFVCRTWGAAPEGFPGDFWESERLEIERYLAKGFQRTVQSEQERPGKRARRETHGGGNGYTGLDFATVAKTGELRARLGRDCPKGAVLVLDQFEELLRRNLRLAQGIVQWVKEGAHLPSDIRVILSLRTDSCHLLEPALRGVRPFSLERVRVNEIEEESVIREIVTRHKVGKFSANESDPDAPQFEGLSDEAAQDLFDAWQEARDDRSARSESPPKVLDLQATLYGLYFGARHRVRRGKAPRFLVEMADLDTLKNQAMGPDGLVQRTSIFALGLRRALGLKFRQAEDAAKEAGLNDFVVTGTRELVRRMVPMLFSGDFKIPQQERELARQALEEQIRSLRDDLEGEIRDLGPESRISMSEVFDNATTVLFQSDSDGDSYLEIARRGVDYLSTRSVASISKGSSGPMMGASVAETLFEEVRLARFGIDWLIALDVVRRDPDGTLVLVHDGAGRALKAWSEDHADDWEVALRQLTGARGHSFLWQQVTIGAAMQQPHSVYANLSWRYCRITTRFRNVIFVNCDFTGSRFLECEFEGVTFVNCLMDDANLEHCFISGEVNQERINRPRTEGGRIRLAPSFTVEASESETTGHHDFKRDGKAGVRHFFSDRSGEPATACNPPHEHRGEWLAHLGTAIPAVKNAPDQVHLVRPTTGGLMMVSGRVCYLTLYGCRVSSDSSVAFHHVSGEGLSIVDQRGGLVDIHDCAIRGVSFSVDRLDGKEAYAHQGADARVNLQVYDSLVSNVYFSGKLRGKACFEYTVVMMLINAAFNDTAGFEVAIRNCRYLCLVNTDAPDDESIEDASLTDATRYVSHLGGSRFKAANRIELADALEAMDYRYRPQEWEKRQRERKQTQ